MDKTKQVSAIVLSLYGKAQDDVLELPTDDLDQMNCRNPNQNIFTIFKKDALTNLFFCLENFENFKRSDNYSVKSFIEEFDKSYYKVKTHNITYTDDVLGF